MNLQTEFRNFTPALLFYIANKNPMLSSNNNKLISYYLALRKTKKGFDFYELVRKDSGGVYFRIVTMLGFKTIVETTTQTYFEDLNEIEWKNKIFEISMKHFSKEEYKALLQGYVKEQHSGCLGVILFFIITIINFYFF